MSPLDLTVWRRFLLLHPDQFESLTYDVRVGDGQAEPEDEEQGHAHEWLQLAQKRIDAVGIWQNTIAIIEVKPKASFTALGQLLVYRDLYTATKKPTASVTLWAVCGSADREVRLTYLRLGVSILEVGD